MEIVAEIVVIGILLVSDIWWMVTSVKKIKRIKPKEKIKIS